MSVLPSQLIVIDDSVRFAFHVWRYLGRSVGIGGEDRKLERNFWEDDGKPRPMDIANGLAAVWWVPGDDMMEEKLDAVVKALKLAPGPQCFLIDMRGQPVADSDGYDEDLGRRALRWLAANARYLDYDDQVIMVSSYETGVIPFEPKPLRIWPKSPETLARLAEKVLAERLPEAASPEDTVAAQRLLHILVTGAGFEVRNDSTGGFGLPPTGDLLAEMGPPFRHGEFSFLPPRRKRLPSLKLKDPEESEQFEVVACGDLDAWWNYLLERELRKNQDTPDARLRSELKMRASIQERDLREAFRRVILKYDWGHLNQTLFAATLGWSAWLTTNYTRFADRAIALAEARKEEARMKGIGIGPWQIVSTSIEALSLSREILHGGGWPKEEQPESFRYLFKLHGDIAHLQTMATAGQDKEFFSSLSLPIDSLHQVYAAAETFLSHSLQNQKRGARLVWHIVGHRLEDWLLRHLIANVCAHVRPSSLDFIVVSRDPKKTRKKLRKFLKENTKKEFVGRVASFPATADEYLARVARTGGLPERGDRGWVRKWMGSLGATSRGTPYVDGAPLTESPGNLQGTQA